jgi:AraC-like DNA-binding protein
VELVAHVSVIRQCLAFLESLGIKDQITEAKTLESALENSPECMHISACHTVDLLESAARVTGRADIGVSWATWLSPQKLDVPIAVLGEQCSSFAERYRLQKRFNHLEDNTASFGIKVGEDEVSFRCSIHPALGPRIEQYVECLVAFNVRIARRMLGDLWRPLRVEFGHAAPPSVVRQRKYFDCPVYYEADHNAVVLRSDDFYRKLPRGNEHLLSFFEQYLTQSGIDRPHEILSEVEALLASQLAGGNANIKRIATLLAMSTRTLQRRLAAQGTDFRTVLANVRMRVLHAYLSQHGIHLARLAHILGFSEASAACHFIKTQTGVSATSLLNTKMQAHPHPYTHDPASPPSRLEEVR